MRSWVFVLRPLLLGLLLTPLCCYWSQDQGVDRIFSLMVPPIALTAIVALLNVPLRHRLPRLALAGGELMILYAMLSVACAMSAEWMDMVAPLSYGFGLYADQNPRWVDKILPYLSPLLFFKEGTHLQDFKNGGQPISVIVAALPLWMPKVLMWTLLLTLLTTAMLCINTLLREQWIHQEKLSFPIVQVPLALAHDGKQGSLWRSRFLWIAFATTFLIDVLNGFSFLYPAIPNINIRFIGDMDKWFSSPPWNQTGWTPIGIFPFISALGFFMPTDLLFSLLFFFFVRKAQQLIAFSLGNEQGVFGGGGLVPAPPYFSEQSWGAFLGLFASAMWFARPHWRKIWNAIETGKDDEGNRGGVRYRTVFILLLLCILGTGVFGVVIGLPFVFVVFYTLLFLMFSVAVTRLRAQLGAPTHEMAFMGPHQLIIDFHGTAGLPPDLVTRTMSSFHIMNRIHRTHPMPSLLEGQYLAERTAFSQRIMFGALFLAIVLGSICGFLTHIYLGYKWTSNPWVAGEVGGVIQQIQDTPRPPNVGAIGAVFIGAGVVFLLDFIRLRIPGFWLHPAGYALAMNFGVDYYWFGLLLVLITKVFVQRFYGLKGYGKLREIAVGLILGEIAAETIWAFFSMLNDNQTTYSISINGKMGWDQ
jgi:hypothetical protein